MYCKTYLYINICSYWKINEREVVEQDLYFCLYVSSRNIYESTFYVKENEVMQLAYDN